MAVMEASSLPPKPSLQVRAILDEIMEKLPEEFNMVELLSKAEERTPYVVVALQECERMNLLTQEMKHSLKELSLGLKVSSPPSPPAHSHPCLPPQREEELDILFIYVMVMLMVMLMVMVMVLVVALSFSPLLYCSFRE